MGEHTNLVVNLDGGLDLVSTHYTLQQALGSAQTLVNYEPSIEGGYRRINGYEKFGSTQPSGGADEVYATYPYADGVVAVSSTGVYFSVDGNTWLQVNRDTYVAQTGTVAVVLHTGNYIKVNGVGTAFLSEYSVGDHIRIDGNIREIDSIVSDTELTIELEIAGGVSAGTVHYANGDLTLAGTISTRTGQGTSSIAWLEEDGDYGSLAITDHNGDNPIGYFRILGTGVSRTYEWDDLGADFSAPINPRRCTILARRLFVANRDGEMGTVFWTDRFQMRRFDGASAGSITLTDPIQTIKPFKDRLIIFCRNSIHQLVEIDDPTNIQVITISSNTGCADGNSVQELGGDLIFLSHDGIRVLNATDQYGDVTFGVISRKIDVYIKELLTSLGSLKLSSGVSRYKNQYRLFYTNSISAPEQQLGLIGTYKLGVGGELGWQWSRIQGIPVASLSSITNDFIPNLQNERIYHGGYDGYVYQHDSGNNFDGGNITSKIELNEIDYGDIGQKKTLHYIRVFGDIEGAIDDIDMNIVYDYSDSETHQPSVYKLVSIGGISLYGEATYGNDAYGGVAKFSKRVLVEGSGFSNKYTFTSIGQGAPYSINSLYVDLRVGAKQ